MKNKKHYIARIFIDLLLLTCIAGVVTIPFWMRAYQGWLRYDDTVFYPMMTIIGLSGILSVFILFTLDRMYKGKLKDGDLEKYTAEQVAEMKASCEQRRLKMEKLYKLSFELGK